MFLAFVALYSVLAALLMSPLLDTGFRNSTVWPEGDASLAIWACAFVAHLPNWLHLHGPFYTDTIYHPFGLNLLANTTSVGLAIFMIPVTWLIGPLGAFNLSIFISIVLSATAIMWCLRRVVSSPLARGVAGLVWAFSPFAMGAFYWGWTNFLFLAVPPVIFWGLVELVHTTVSPRRLGLIVGLALGIQTLIGAEVAAMTVVGVLAILVFVGVPYAAYRRRWPLDLTWSRLWRVGAWALTSFIPIAVPVALFAAYGPAHLSTWVWPKWIITGGWSWSRLVADPIGIGSLGFHWNPVFPSSVFFGWPLIVAAGFAMIFLRGPVARIVSVLGLMGLWFMRGSAVLTPLTIVWNLPLFRNIIAGRFVIFTWFAVAVLAAMCVDRAVDFFNTRPTVRSVRIPVVALGLIIAFYQPAHAVIGAGPWNTQSPRHELALSQYAESLHTTKVVMPFPPWKGGASIIQQATENLDIQLVSGWGPQPGFSPREEAASHFLVYMNATLLGLPTHQELEDANFFMNSRGVDTILIPRRIGIPRERGYIQPYQLAALFTYMYGQPEEYGNSWKWEKPQGQKWHLTHEIGLLTKEQWKRCAWGVGRYNPRGVPLCVIKASSHTPR